MRKIHVSKIEATVAQLCIQANVRLRADVHRALFLAQKKETNKRAKRALGTLLENAACAWKTKLALCQDTGLAYVFAEIGQDVSIVGGDFTKAVNRGIEKGYKRGSLRNSIVSHPLKRGTGSGFSPGVVLVNIVRGSSLTLTVLPKGFGSENKSAAIMCNPTASLDEIKNFVIEKVKQAGANACPPFVIGVGIGGGFDYAAYLAKRALLRPIDKKNPDRLLAKLEKELLKKINALNIGALGLGGKSTSLGVNILSYPTHIAGLPIAINISCHALRSASKRL